MKYTKNNWSPSEPKKLSTNRYKCTIGRKIGGWMTGLLTAIVFGDTEEEVLANTRLVISAPMMYETLLKISKYRNTEAGQLAIKAIKELIK